MPFISPQDKVSLSNPGYPGTYSVDRAGLEFRDPPASASHCVFLIGIAWSGIHYVHQAAFELTEIASASSNARINTEFASLITPNHQNCFDIHPSVQFLFEEKLRVMTH